MAEQTPLASDDRVARRRRVLKDGKILLNNGLSTFDCTIRDLSPTGAKLILDDPASVPDTFRLAFPLNRTMRDVKVAWRKPGLMGVHFTSEPRKAPLLKW